MRPGTNGFLWESFGFCPWYSAYYTSPTLFARSNKPLGMWLSYEDFISTVLEFPDELRWLRARQCRSLFVCHMGFFGLFWAFYKLAIKRSCDTQTGPNLIHVPRDAASTMTENQQLTPVVNGKVTYLVKTTDILSTKLKQLITSVLDIDRSFATWNKQVTKQFNKEECHYQENLEFISLYSLHVNRAMSAMLRLTEIEDILRQLSHGRGSVRRKLLFLIALLKK